MGLRKTSVAIDEELLDAARDTLDTKTVKDTIERAFRAVIAARARREEVEALSTMRGMDLGDERVMGGAWRK